MDVQKHGKGCHSHAGEEVVSRAPHHEASCARAFLSDQLGEESGPHPAAAVGTDMGCSSKLR